MTKEEKEIILRQKKAFLDALSDKYDKKDGSVIADIATANAISNLAFFKDLNDIKKNLDYRTAKGINLDDVANNYGIYRQKAKFSTGFVKVIGDDNTFINKGFTFSNDTTSFKTLTPVTIKNGIAIIEVMAEIEGEKGNATKNSIINIPMSLNGLKSVINLKSFLNGRDKESDDELKIRIDKRLRYPATSGNKNHYYKWAREVAGVGEARIIVKPKGAGSMKVVIVDEDNNPAKKDLCDFTKKHILETRPATSGMLEVVTANILDINVEIIKLSIDGLSGLSFIQVKDNIINNLINFINNFAMDSTSVTYAGVVKTVIKTIGVSDYQGLTLNDGNSSIKISNLEIPKSKNIIISG